MDAFLPNGRGSDRGTEWNFATMTAPYFTDGFRGALVADHAKRIRAPIGWVGDLNPHSIHVYGSLRSGKMEAPDLHGKALRIAWLGMDDGWLRRLKKPSRFEIAMDWAEREHWNVLKRMLPNVQELIGPKSFAALNAGVTFQIDSFPKVVAHMVRERLHDRLPVRNGR